MKLLFVLWLGSVCVAQAGEMEIRIRRHGTNVTAQPSMVFATNVMRLVQSSSVDSTSYAVKKDIWETLLRSDSFVYLKPPAPARIPAVGEMLMDELLVPLPEGKFPAHLFSRSGTNVFACAKFSPVAFGKVALEPALGLGSVEPYASVAKLAAGRGDH
jgi:hypothetical protein